MQTFIEYKKEKLAEMKKDENSLMWWGMKATATNKSANNHLITMMHILKDLDS